jgi:hypothetical protein
MGRRDAAVTNASGEAERVEFLPKAKTPSLKSAKDGGFEAVDTFLPRG